MRPGSTIQYTWKYIEYLIKYCGADLEEFLTIEVENE